MMVVIFLTISGDKSHGWMLINGKSGNLFGFRALEKLPQGSPEQ